MLDRARHLAVASDILKERKAIERKGPVSDPRRSLGKLDVMLGRVAQAVRFDSEAIAYERAIDLAALAAELAEQYVEHVKPAKVMELRAEEEREETRA